MTDQMNPQPEDEVFDEALEDEEEFEDEPVILYDEDGNAIECEYLDTITYKDEEYDVLLACTDDELDGEVIIFKTKVYADAGEEYLDYEPVESEELLNTLFNIFKIDHADDYDFE